MIGFDSRLSAITFTARCLAIFAVLSVPISTAAVNVATLAFIPFALASPEFRHGWRVLYRNRVALCCIVLILLMAASLTYTVAPQHEAMQWLMKFRKLALLPLLIIVFAGATRRWQDVLRYGFVAATTFVMLLSTTNYLGWTHLGGLYNAADPVQHAWVFKNHITAGIFGALLFTVCVNEAVHAGRRAAMLAWYALAAWTLLNVFVMLQGRTGQVIAALMCLYHMGVLLWALGRPGQNKKRWRALLFLIPCLVLIGVSYHLKGDRMADIGNEYHDYQHSNEVTSVGLRIEWYRKSLEILSKRPLEGYGIAGLQYQFDALTKGLTGARGTPTENPHNQYLLMAVEFGLIGLTVFIALLVLIARSARALPQPSRHFLFGYWWTFVIGCLANSLLLDFSEGWLFVLLAGILVGATVPAGAVRRAPGSDVSPAVTPDGLPVPRSRF